jgi:hypothetical protein
MAGGPPLGGWHIAVPVGMCSSEPPTAGAVQDPRKAPPPRRPWQATSLAARVSELESELDAARSEARSFGSMAASKERNTHRRLEGLQDELEHAHEQVCGGMCHIRRVCIDGVGAG